VLHHLTLWVPDLRRAAGPWGWLLGELGYEPDAGADRLLLFRRDGFALVLEQSPDMVPGMLYSRLRPGMNHLALVADGAEQLRRIEADAPGHGWTLIDSDRHRVAGDADVLFLEDPAGFEIELVATPRAASAG
jgi:catechol 2,3-dioxygenase-like lactoylglutathione lyase family enzyme